MASKSTKSTKTAAPTVPVISVLADRASMAESLSLAIFPRRGDENDEDEQELADSRNRIRGAFMSATRYYGSALTQAHMARTALHLEAMAALIRESVW